MVKLFKTITADVLRYQLGGLVAAVVGVVDILSGQRLGVGVDYGLVATGLAALGLHVSDFNLVDHSDGPVAK